MYSGKNAPRTNELYGAGNRCTKALQTAVEEEEGIRSPPSPPDRPKVREFINYRTLNPNNAEDAKILRAAMPSAEAFEEFNKGIDIEKFYEDMEWAQFHKDFSFEDMEMMNAHSALGKKGELLPSKPQSVVNMIMKQVAMKGSDKRGLLAWHSSGSGKIPRKTAHLTANLAKNKEKFVQNSTDTIHCLMVAGSDNRRHFAKQSIKKLQRTNIH
jgi:hypothetical protein